MAGSILLRTESPQQTERLGRKLGEMAKPGDVFLLIGELGSGKTCLVKGIAQGLGVEEVVLSPSFILVREYKGRLPLYHIDLYRLNDLQEIALLGLEDYLYGKGVVAIEWAERAKGLWPAEYLLIHIKYSEENSRSFLLSAQGERYQPYLELKWS